MAKSPPPPLPAPEVEVEPVQVEKFEAELAADLFDLERQIAEIEREALREPPPLGGANQPAVDPEEMALLDELTEAAIPEAPVALSDEERLRRTPSELPLVLNSHVEKLINYFTKTKRGKATMRLSLGRGNAYRELIDRILEEENVPAELFYLAMAESGFRPKARSYAYATGMWQFMSWTGKQYGLKQDRYVDLRYAVERATRASAKHLRDLYIEFGDWYLAMAAYNCGPNRVRRSIARADSNDYWELSRRRLLPSQTREYVPIILAMTYVGKNLDLFDIGEIDPAPTLELDRVETDSEISFALIADITGVSTEAVKELNPALLRSATPPYGYDLSLPRGTRERFLKEIALVPADKRINWRRRQLKSGETLEAAAKRFGVKAETLAELNGLEPDAPLDGRFLTIPTTTKLASYRPYGGGRPGGLLDPGTGRYRIARGDTLGAIAQHFGTSVATLRAWNGLAGTAIRAGRYLIVRPEGAGEQASSSAVSPSGGYKVRRGDTLGKIAGRYGVSVTQLKTWNGLRSSTIHIGQTLKVPGSSSSSPAPTRSASASIPARSEPAAGPGQYRIRGGDSLITIAQRFGVTVDDLRQWNNMRGSRITAGKYLTVRPPSSSVSARAAVASAPKSTQPKGNGTLRYTVRSGDTLGHIAEKFGVRTNDLRIWNGIRGSSLAVGQSLLIKEQPASAAAAKAPVAASNSKAQARVTSPPTTTYTVRSGDTLDKIAGKFGVPTNDLRFWNGISGSRINVGQKLTLRASLSDSRYKIRRGDTLDVIARLFDVSVADLKQWNGLRSSRIVAGDYLVIRRSGS